jgi:hypothetical protein
MEVLLYGETQLPARGLQGPGAPEGRGIGSFSGCPAMFTSHSDGMERKDNTMHNTVIALMQEKK